ncbi:(2Fe-2S)-binding protein [Williamsia sp. M5A3_1d]
MTEPVSETDDTTLESEKRNGVTRRTFMAAGGTAMGGVVVAGVVVANTGLFSSSDDPTSPPSTSIRLTVNGIERSLEVDNRSSLLDTLREDLGLPGTKRGCNAGACGACTVLVDDRRVVSCLTLAARLDGATVTTIEGLADGDQLHPLQQAFIDQDAFQCGFCTPGQIMSGVGCIREGHTGSADEIREWMSGNICRCGCYPKILSALTSVAERS